MSTTAGQAPGVSAPAIEDKKVFATAQAKAALLGLVCDYRPKIDRFVIWRSTPLCGTDGRQWGWLTRGSEIWYFSTIEKAADWLDHLDQPGTEVPA